jgi:hypothetical protein
MATLATKVPYTPEMKLDLCTTVMAFKAFHKSAGQGNLSDRWDNVTEQLKTKASFIGKELKSQNIRNRFFVFLDEVVKESGTDKEGVNLSGKVQPSKYVQMMLHMAHYISEKEEVSKDKKDKKKAIQKALLTHEHGALENQSKLVFGGCDLLCMGDSAPIDLSSALDGKYSLPISPCSSPSSLSSVGASAEASAGASVIETLAGVSTPASSAQSAKKQRVDPSVTNILMNAGTLLENSSSARFAAVTARIGELTTLIKESQQQQTDINLAILAQLRELSNKS